MLKFSHPPLILCLILTKCLTSSQFRSTLVHNVQPFYLLTPNPANDNIRILLKDAEIHKRVKLTIYSNDGRIVYESIITSNFENIDISGFSNGIYLVNLNSEKINLNSKFIKQ